uniref:Uncharacterized protein n=1 Tax=Anguilla anguilla TaxID=7936 RepID=A0A0E9USI0_ANGAN
MDRVEASDYDRMAQPVYLFHRLYIWYMAAMLIAKSWTKLLIS